MENSARSTEKMAARPSLKSHHSHPPPSRTKHVKFILPTHAHARRSQWGFNQLIPAHPGISQMDEAAPSLANILAFLDGDAGIPQSLLARAGRPLRRWDGVGEPEALLPTQSGIMPELADILCNPERTQTAIQHLSFHSLLNVDLVYGGAGSSHHVLRMDAGTRAMYKQNMPDTHRWMLQAVLLVCHAFPTSAHLDPEFYDIGLAYISQIRHVMAHYYDTLHAMDLLSVEIQRTVAYALVASSHFSSAAWRSEAINRAEKIAAKLTTTPDECLRIMILARKTSLKHLDSDRLLLTTHKSLNLTAKSKTFNALLGELFLARSTSYLHAEDEDIDTAFALLQPIQPLDRDRISTLEELVLQKKAICWGRIWRLQGRFDEARQLLEAICNAKHSPRGVLSVGASSCDLISELAAVYCELRDPVRAERLVLDKLESFEDDGNGHYQYYRIVQRKEEDEDAVWRLRLALAEAVLQQGEYWRAEDIYRDVSRYLCITQTERPESIRTVCRLKIGLARVQHVQGEWESALRHWERALKVYEKCTSLQDFGTVAVLASIAYVKDKLGEKHDAALYADKARKLFEVAGRPNWYTGLRTLWLDEVTM